MAPQNFTVNDNSPTIYYTPSGGWSTGSKTLDSEALSYSDGGTFTVTQTAGTRASFTFNGTNVYVYGAKRFNHGAYSVELDGIKNNYNGSSDEELFQQLLFSSGPLEGNGPHTLYLQCDGSGDYGWLDLDYITWTVDLGDDITSQVTIPDSHSNFSYTGPWSTTDAGGRYEGGTAHLAVDGNSYVTFEFSGESVGMYGAVGLAYGRYTVQLDGGNIEGYDASKKYTETQALLYHANNIGGGTHKLVLANAPAQNSPQTSILIDYAVVSRSEHPDIALKETQPSKETQKLSTGVLVGIAFGGFVLIAAVALLALLIIRRKRKFPDSPIDEVGPSRDPLVQPFAYSSGSQTPVTDKGRPTLRGSSAHASTSTTVPGMQQIHHAESMLPPDYDMAVGPSSSRARA
ncbi:hypothetical protein K525DRAFT_264179 [Schizophyllum commune Loenen D]|nr:hypothetical protein K525DRAFT_264179 [Schizophyllum commune Loenen D]